MKHSRLLLLFCVFAALAAYGIDGVINNISRINNSGDYSPPEIAASASLSFDARALRFSWNDIFDATHYRLLEDPDGLSGFRQVGRDIFQGTQSIDHVVPLYSRIDARYILQSCNEKACTNDEPIFISGTLVDAVGSLKAGNTGWYSWFGWAVILSTDGQALVVRAKWKDNTGKSSVTNNSVRLGWSGVVYIFNRSGGNWFEQASLSG